MTGFLLDTHTVLWWSLQSPRLSQAAAHAVSGAIETGGAVFVSAASVYEADYKAAAGRLGDLKGASFRDVVASDGWLELPITFEDAALAARLDHSHGDPFDRFLAAQALNGDLTVITRDPAISALGARTLW